MVLDLLGPSLEGEIFVGFTPTVPSLPGKDDEADGMRSRDSSNTVCGLCLRMTNHRGNRSLISLCLQISSTFATASSA